MTKIRSNRGASRKKTTIRNPQKVRSQKRNATKKSKRISKENLLPKPKIPDLPLKK